METLRTRVWKSTGVKIVLVLPFLVLFLLGACNLSDVGTSGFSTYTPTASATPTCEPNTGVSTPGVWTKSPSQLVVILFDPRFTGSEYIELVDGERTQDIPSFVSRVAPKLMKFGDQVAIFQLGYSSYDDARIARLYSYLAPPPLSNKPTPPFTMTPIPTIGTPTPGLELVATKNAYMLQSTAQARAATATQAKVNCALDYFKGDVHLTATSYYSTATKDVGDISSEIAQGLAQKTSEKPFSTNETYYGGVYYGLNFATTIFQSDCKNYSSCILLMIDDMHVFGKDNPDNLAIDLTGVKTYVIMANCQGQDLLGPNCKPYEDYWNGEFPKYNGAAPIYLSGVQAETNLLSAIGR